MDNYNYYNITSLDKLSSEVQDFILNSIKIGFQKNIIKNKEWFMKINRCVYTSQILSLCSNFKIKVVEGVTVDKQGEMYFHCWNEYEGVHFNLIKDNHNYLDNYGRIILKRIISTFSKLYKC